MNNTTILKCKYCYRKAKNKNSNVQHEIRCNLNPDKLDHGDTWKLAQKTKKKSNQYLKAKENNEEYVLSKEARRKITEANRNRSHSKETKEKISKSRIKYLRDNPDMVPYKLNHYSKGRSYPEEYWKDVLDNANLVYEEQYQIGPYQLDFAFVDNKIDLEIDGEQHYLDQRIAASDKRRTEYLNELGWITIRVRWSDYQRMNDYDRQAFVDDIINALSC